MEVKEQILQSKKMHLDQLVDKLKEELVRRVVEPLLNSDLQWIFNSCGKIISEYGLGMGRTNLFILVRLPRGNFPRARELQQYVKMGLDTKYK